MVDRSYILVLSYIYGDSAFCRSPVTGCTIVRRYPKIMPAVLHILFNKVVGFHIDVMTIAHQYIHYTAIFLAYLGMPGKDIKFSPKTGPKLHVLTSTLLH